MLTGLPIVNLGRLPRMEKAGKSRTGFGERMHQARKVAKLTQEAACAALSPHVAQSTLSELETTAAGSSRTAEFAVAYKCNGHWLATGEGAPEFGIAHTKHTKGGMPFSDLNPFEVQAITLFRKLSSDQQHQVLIALNDLVPQGEKASTSNPFLGGKGRVRGISRFGDLGEPEAQTKKSSK